ncbi:uncharacterized protein M421DRAFT_416744 [Didymella exigua CBS 183.55]|uniref:Glutaredoxin domain-containing protein n=1 Tax=Didymella exigua CBS 183.55 TaxID=1150837 RepID=A0A6A5RXS0_9PLEO|nr:uncharacterized protein M421DRAFT_416744 [Didymella exigua CBS 183.55]KAF1932014.1 hypothetical protein M421DRAFT_416744 [Didymella exigua CBS 183.55]
MAELAVFDKDPNIYLFTSLTAGSSHIITATSRIETILKANKIPFIGLDTATHELGRKLFQRRASGKKLPLLVKEGYVLGGIEEIEEWNEYDELHEALGVDTAFTAYPPKPTSLFEPAPSKTPPPLAGALPGGFSFGQAGDSPFASLGAVGGSRAKENAPVASAEQNLAIRQMGAEAAKIAASKKPVPVKISTTNPLLTEKTNAKGPADVLSPKSTPLPKSPSTASNEKKESGAKKTELPDLLSPRSIPLPQTPGVAPKLEQQKPVHAPPSMHEDAENPALSAGPIKETQAQEESSEEEKDSDEEESSEESATEKKAGKTQEQDPKDASKAGASVKEGEQEEESREEESEDEAKAGAAVKKEETEPAETKPASPTPQPKQSSSEENSEEEDDESEEDVKKVEVKKTQTQDAKDASKAGESVLD